MSNFVFITFIYPLVLSLDALFITFTYPLVLSLDAFFSLLISIGTVVRCIIFAADKRCAIYTFRDSCSLLINFDLFIGSGIEKGYSNIDHSYDRGEYF